MQSITYLLYFISPRRWFWVTLNYVIVSSIFDENNFLSFDLNDKKVDKLTV